MRQVLGASKVESRFEARHQSGTLPLLGREEELDLFCVAGTKPSAAKDASCC